MIKQNSSGFKIPITTKEITSGDLTENDIGYIWYETTTDKIKLATKNESDELIIKEL